MQASPRVAQRTRLFGDVHRAHGHNRRAHAQRAMGWLVAVIVGASSPVVSAAPEASEEGRRRVRGDRAERASIHAAWTPPAYDPDREDHASLQAFEEDTLAGSQTIALVAPEPWMKKLAMPGLPVRWNQGLVEYLRYFTKDPRGMTMMRAWLKRAGRYEKIVRKILAEHDVPEDLVWVVMAESGFNPRVRSAAGAAGPWQFMEGTGGVYGLPKSYWIDWRYDIEKSTVAAATYLQDLRVRFGSWELALAAYNAGYGLVTTAIERHNTNNFWALAQLESGLPHATVNYVPKIVAAAIVAKNREALGFTRASVAPLESVEWAFVDIDHSTSLAEIARVAGVDPDLLAELNAHFHRGRTPPGMKTKVRLPRGATERFTAARAELATLWAAQATHVAREGERLDEIAALHGISEKDLRKKNGIRDAAEITAGVVLVVPVSKDAALAAAPAARPLAAVPPVEIENDQRLLFFEVTRATTTASLVKAFGSTWDRIVAWNDLDPHARLQPGQLLQMVVSRGFDPASRGVVVYELRDVHHVLRGSREHIETSLARRGKIRRAVKARRGDTLESIGRRSDLTTGDLARINGYPRDHALVAGELVIVYVDERRRKGTVDAPAPRGPSADAKDDEGDASIEHGASEVIASDEPRTVSPPPARTRERSTHAPSTASSSRVPARRRGSP